MILSLYALDRNIVLVNFKYVAYCKVSDMPPQYLGDNPRDKKCTTIYLTRPEHAVVQVRETPDQIKLGLIK